jgi:VanZ family protein
LLRGADVWSSLTVIRNRLFFKYWLPVLIWMMVIFSASRDSQSFDRSSRIIGPFIHFLFPNMSDASVNRIVTAARKCAHLAEYAVLSVLFWRAVTKPVWKELQPWNWRVAGVSVAFVAIYAATDEFHQSLVPGRQGSALDVVLDTVGGMAGMLLLWLIWKFRNQRTMTMTEVC